MKLIVGLGNPGKEYENTNHNIGFRVLDEVVKQLGIKFDKKPVAESLIATFGVGENKIIFAKPQTYMNNSGLSVKQLLKRFSINPATDLVVVSDDFDTKEGTIRIREKSGNTTHNGIRSIKNEILTNEFIRIKVSIAPKPEFVPIVDFVLSKSSHPSIKQSQETAVNAVLDLVRGDSLSIVMGKYSK